MSSCSIRSLWILNSQDAVVFSRRFPVVEKRWRTACERESGSSVEGNVQSSHCELCYRVTRSWRRLLPSGREGHCLGYHQNILRPPISPPNVNVCELIISSSEGSLPSQFPVCGCFLLRVLHKNSAKNEKLCTAVLEKLVLPSVPAKAAFSFDPLKHVKLPFQLSSHKQSFVLSQYLFAFMVEHTIGDIITGDLVDPQVIVSTSPSVVGLLDSLTGSIGISSISGRTKPTAAPIAASATSGTSVSGVTISDTFKSTSRPIDQNVLHTFISSSMPFGTPLGLNFSNISVINTSGFSSTDAPVSDLKQPAWKPYLYKGKQRVLFTISEIVYAAMYDRDEIPDIISVSGQANCRAELEGLPDVSLPLSDLKAARVNVSSFHHCVQVSEQGMDKQALVFAPPLGNFVLMRYQASCGLNPPVKGFYQLSMVSEDEGAFLFKLRLMEGYKGPLSMELCTIVMPFPRRRLACFDGNPSIGTASMTEHSVEWKIVANGRGITGKSIEASFPGTVKFFPRTTQRIPTRSSSTFGNSVEYDSDIEQESSTNIEEYLAEKMNRDLQAVDMEEPLCWQAYNYAKVSYKISGGTLSGLSIDSKTVSIYPAVKAPVEISMQASSGDYILWNTLGKCPAAASPKISDVS